MIRYAVLSCVAAVWMLCCLAPAGAAPFVLYDDSRDLIGGLNFTEATQTDTLIDIARAHGLGYEQIIKANPEVNRWVPGEGRRVLLSSRYILPDTPRSGITLNLPELRLYYYAPSKPGFPQVVHTFPVSIGRMDWKTPLGTTKIVRKDKNPPWYPPPSIRKEHAREGEILPPFIPGGDPENPLGKFALRLGLPMYLIHGVDERKAFGIGMRVTHGCIRMYPEDIEKLFSMAEVGTAVHLIDQPVKAGWLGSLLFLEVHKPLAEDEYEHGEISKEQVDRVIANRSEGRVRINWEIVEEIIARGDGIPRPIGRLEDEDY